MKLFLDTNVLIDHLIGREPYAAAVQQLCVAAFFGDVQIWVSTQSFMDAQYALRRFAPARELRDASLACLEFFRPCNVRAADLKGALESDWPDAEDWMIVQSAQNVGADFLLTRDSKGFAASKVKAITADELVVLMEERGLTYSEIEL